MERGILINHRMRDAIGDHKAHGRHFFDDDMMEFFNIKIELGMTNNNLFITSEDDFDKTRILYTVRKYDWEKHWVIIVSKFQEFETLEDAMNFVNRY